MGNTVACPTAIDRYFKSVMGKYVRGGRTKTRKLSREAFITISEETRVDAINLYHKEGYPSAYYHLKEIGIEERTIIKFLINLDTYADGWHTYIIYSEQSNIIKIGKTTQRPDCRISSISSYIDECLIPLIIIVGDVEEDLHQKFASIRVNHPVKHKGSSEWFLNDGQILDYLDTLKP